MIFQSMLLGGGAAEFEHTPRLVLTITAKTYVAKHFVSISSLKPFQQLRKVSAVVIPHHIGMEAESHGW